MPQRTLTNWENDNLSREYLWLLNSLLKKFAVALFGVAALEAI
ncbi:hypothetical protein [Sporomusa termitida]